MANIMRTYRTKRRPPSARSTLVVSLLVGALALFAGFPVPFSVTEAVSAASDASSSKPKGSLYALLVGISNYQDERITKLDFAANDAKAFGEVLKRQNYVYDKLHIQVLLDKQATKRAIVKFLKGDLRRAGKDDTVVLFFSGHGVYDPERTTDFYFCPYDLELDYLAASGVKMSGLYFLRAIKTKRILVVADACHSGGFSKFEGITKDLPPNITRFLKEFENSAGKVILTSSGPNQLSWQMKDIDGQPPLKNSVFTYFLLQGLKGKADVDRNGIVTVREAYEYAFGMTNAATNGKQEPQISGRHAGVFPLTFSGTVVPPRKLKRSLLQAVEAGNIKKVIELRAQLLDITNVRDERNRTPLIIAAEEGHPAIVKLVLEQRPDLESKSDAGNTALIAAAENGHADIVKLLLDKGANPNNENKSEETALTRAARNGHLDVVKALLENGANVRSRNDKGSTALALAAYKGHADIVSLLLDHKAEISPRDYLGRTPLSHACRYGRKDVIKILAARMPKSKTLSSEDNVISAIMLGNVRRVHALLEGGAPIDIKTEFGDTPLTLASSLGSTELARILLDKGADVNSKISYGSAALAWASYNGHADVVKLLLSRGAAVDAQDDGAATALCYAAQMRRLKVVKLLCAYGAGVNHQDAEGATPLMLLLSDAGGGDDRKSTGDVTAIAKILLDKGAEPDKADKKGITALMLAAEHGYADAARLLLERNADVNARSKKQYTALILAAENGHTGIVEQLVSKGAALSRANQKGQNALFLAARNGHVDTVMKLLAHGADARAETLEGETPLETASTGGYTRIVKALEDHGAR